jgi:tRNA pseudouridine55 synthase
VLPVCLGNATKLCDLLTDKTKEYEAVLRLGVTTDTQDMTGKILTEQEVCTSEDDIRNIMSTFIGKSTQIPPMYSAVKINGKRLYELAREGKEVERRPREIEIYELEITDISLPLVTFRVSCSKGTYIRTLCQDIGEKAGCGGAMERLVRTRVERFLLKDAVTLAQVEELSGRGMLDEILYPVDVMFSGYPAVTVLESCRKVIENGNVLTQEMYRAGKAKSGLEQTPEKRTGSGDKEKPTHGERIRVYDEAGQFYGIYEYNEKLQCCKPFKMFLPEKREGLS